MLRAVVRLMAFLLFVQVVVGAALLVFITSNVQCL